MQNDQAEQAETQKKTKEKKNRISFRSRIDHDMSFILYAH